MTNDQHGGNHCFSGQIYPELHLQTQELYYMLYKKMNRNKLFYFDDRYLQNFLRHTLNCLQVDVGCLRFEHYCLRYACSVH